MIFMPPRHGKSELASRRFPAWYVGRYPENSIIAASYNSDLANDFGREVRNIVNSPQYKALFDTRLAGDSQAANRWHTDKGGAYVAAGVGTAVTGRGANILLIDDPLKDREEADSETIRDKVWNWYTSTAYTRLEDEIVDEGETGYEGAIVLIQTRWHEDDLAGRLLEAQEKGGDDWEVLDLPALNKAGEALWPQKYTAERLNRIRVNIGVRDWTALYQQSPAPEDGDFFKREWLRFYDDPPPYLKTYGASDYAVTADDGDYTVHGVFAVDDRDDIYILDWWREQTETATWIEVLIGLIQQHSPMAWAEESGQILKSLDPFIRKRMRETKAYCYREQFTSAHDKPTRARSIQARMSMGRLYLPRNAPWLDKFMTELLVFPNGKNDDQVDVLSLLGRLLDRLQGGKKPKEEEKPKFPGQLSFKEEVDLHMKRRRGQEQRL